MTNLTIQGNSWGDVSSPLNILEALLLVLPAGVLFMSPQLQVGLGVGVGDVEGLGVGDGGGVGVDGHGVVVVGGKVVGLTAGSLL